MCIRPTQAISIWPLSHVTVLLLSVFEENGTFWWNAKINYCYRPKTDSISEPSLAFNEGVLACNPLANKNRSTEVNVDSNFPDYSMKPQDDISMEKGDF